MSIHALNSPPSRVLVVGTTGSGKTTLAKALSAKLGLLHIEGDALRFLPNWQVRPNDDLRALVRQMTDDNDRWVIDGNYSILRDILWARADTAIWLDYSFHLTLWRLTRRTVRRITTKEDLWGTGNRESWRNQLRFNDDSLFYWFFKTYWRRKREFPRQFADYPNLRVLRFTHPRETEAWLAALSPDSGR